MMCFRDRVFCPFGDDCASSVTCRKVLTERIQTEASMWWGKPGAPICVYSDKPECHKPLEFPPT